jgi:hypothetical protein
LNNYSKGPKLEDNLNILEMEDNLNILGQSGRRAQFFGIIEDYLIILSKTEITYFFLAKYKTTSICWKMEYEHNFKVNER